MPLPPPPRPCALAPNALLLFPLQGQLREHVASVDRGRGAIGGVHRGCAEGRRKGVERAKKEARLPLPPLSCSLLLSQKQKSQSAQKTSHRRPRAPRLHSRSVAPSPSRGNTRSSLVHPRSRPLARSLGRGFGEQTGEWLFCRRPAAAAAAAASRSRSRPLFLFSLFPRHYVRFLAAALPALGHSLVLSDRHDEIKAEKKEALRKKGGKVVKERRAAAAIEVEFFFFFFSFALLSLSLPLLLSFSRSLSSSLFPSTFNPPPKKKKSTRHIQFNSVQFWFFFFTPACTGCPTREARRTAPPRASPSGPRPT